MLIAALILAASPDPCVINPLSWNCAVESIISRSFDERNLIFTVLEAQIANDVPRLDVDTPRHRCWVAKVAGFEYLMLSNAAKNDPDMERYYIKVSAAYQARVDQKIDDDALVVAIKGIKRPYIDEPSEQLMISALEGELGPILKNASDALIADAKGIATGFKSECEI
jgi:hypothetical protein